MRKKSEFKINFSLYLMLLPGVIIVLVYGYGPMVGILMAFEKYIPARGLFHSQWVGLGNFQYMVNLPGIFKVLWNTIYIAFMKIMVGFSVPIIFALLLNEIGNVGFKRVVQTVIYLPYFLSWVILGGIFVDLLSPSTGIVNQFLQVLGLKPIFFLGDAKWFPYTLVITNVWKDFGFGTIIYLAAITGIDPSLYESALIDGASRWKQTLHITLPGMMPIIVLSATLSIGGILDAGFDQVLNLYSPLVYDTGDIIDTFVYRLGIVDAHYSVATAAGLFQSVTGLIFITVSYQLAYRYAGYRIF